MHVDTTECWLCKGSRHMVWFPLSQMRAVMSRLKLELTKHELVIEL
jgi:hypothetical protein